MSAGQQKLVMKQTACPQNCNDPWIVVDNTFYLDYRRYFRLYFTVLAGRLSLLFSVFSCFFFEGLALVGILFILIRLAVIICLFAFDVDFNIIVSIIEDQIFDLVFFLPPQFQLLRLLIFPILSYF